MSNSDNEMEDYIEKVKGKLSLGSKKRKSKNTKHRISFNFNSLSFNPYMLYLTSFLVIFILLLIVKPRIVKKLTNKGRKVVFSKLLLMSILIYIPVFFFLFLFFGIEKK